VADRVKVFGVGFHKTGTTSLKHALQILGYTVTGPDARDHVDPARTALEACRRLSYEFDAFQDNPWPLLYREMDELHPGSRFILTVRPTDQWIRSMVSHFGTDDTAMRRWIYGHGHPLGNERVYIDRYERHTREVRAYFSQRPEDLLELAITDGQGWEPLCSFLGEPVPNVPFPRSNSAVSRRRKRRLPHRILRRLRSLGSERGSGRPPRV
jgi:hypothetical protein